ncbi:tyrosine-type recombinase/integrase [Modicisalibacter luteus]|uniref:tyrosine-type recombinase/integrase n=1 Tax=Modicisalibacter luteus TaxID=453962 RepID=UPI00363F9562
MTETGFTRWMMRYKSPVSGKRREVTLGKYPDLPLSDARERAAEWRKLLAHGQDPKDERDEKNRTQMNTLDSVWDNYYAIRCRRVASHRKELSLYKREIQPELGSISVSEVKPNQVQRVLHKIAFESPQRPTVANDALWLIKTLFNHAIKLGLTAFNPAFPFKESDAGGKEIPRDRVLLDDEIQTLKQSIRQAGLSFSRPNHIAIALLLVLGVRKMELLSAQWTAFDLETGIWQLDRGNTKTRHPITIPLEPKVIELMKELKVHGCGSNYVFPAHRKTKRFGHMSPDTLNVALKSLNHPLKPFTVHDLRRTCRTKLAELEVEPHIAERYINHKINTYDRHDYVEQRRQAQRLLIDAFWPLIVTEPDARPERVQKAS